MAVERRLLYYTFGNHMHWVDMEWLWGYAVLPDLVRDMLSFCAATGVKGNVNFDGIGYGTLAVEAPEALAELRDCIARPELTRYGAQQLNPAGLHTTRSGP
jgi:alpha-mannosidase